MRNTYGTQAPSTPSDFPDPMAVAIRGAMREYWAAVALGDENGKSRAKSKVQRFELLAQTRRTTQRMLAVVDVAIPEPSK